MHFLTLLFPLLLFMSCHQPGGEPLPEIVVSSTDTESITPPKINPYDDSLRLYFESPVDFYALKKQTEHMHSGGTIGLPEKYFHKTDDPDAIFYTYWTIEFMPPKYKDDHSLDFAVWKPWRTAKQKYYEADNETLVGIRSCIEWEGLGKSNFVGMNMDSLYVKFGPAHYERGTCSIYQQNDHLLVLDAPSGKIKWFKYYWWHEPVYSWDTLPEEVFTW